MPNSWHKAVNDFPGRVAATTNFTFCSSTSMVFHGILYTPALATLARKCKGCPETFCKGCHETEQPYRQGRVLSSHGWSQLFLHDCVIVDPHSSRCYPPLARNRQGAGHPLEIGGWPGPWRVTIQVLGAPLLAALSVQSHDILYSLSR